MISETIGKWSESFVSVHTLVDRRDTLEAGLAQM